MVLSVVLALSVLGGTGIGVAASGSGTPPVAAEPVAQSDVRGDVRIENYRPPDILERDRVYSTGVTIENGGDRTYRIDLGYHFEGEFVTTKRLEIDPGESIRESISFQVSDIESVVGSVESGQRYIHGAAVAVVDRDGDRTVSDRVEMPVRIAPTDDRETDSSTEGDEETGTDPPDVDLEAELPNALEYDRTYRSRIRVVNNADREVRLELGYLFDGTVVLSGEIAVGPNGAIQEELPIRVDEIEDTAGPLDPEQEYSHQLVVRAAGGEVLDEVREPVRIAPGSDASGGETDDSQRVSPDESEDEEEYRGFLTNDPDSSVAFLDDPMFLTVGGFLLSVLGILYQMAGGG